MRILITGMGGELGTRVAMLLEEEQEVESILGLDIDPPRRRMRRADYLRVDPLRRQRTIDAIRAFEPSAVLHLGIYEPNARTNAGPSLKRTEVGTLATFEALSGLVDLDRIVVRSGIEVYGRRRGTPSFPDETTPPDPTTPFGAALLHVEESALALAESTGVAVGVLRMAPLVGPHFPSPLGRYLRLPIVPVSGLFDPPFSLLHQEDAAHAIVAALHARHSGLVNVVGNGVVTGLQAARMGRRVALPIFGPAWRSARLVSNLAGAPVPEHVLELLRRGRTADGSRVEEAIGFQPSYSTPDVVKHLFEWASVVYLEVEPEPA